MVILFNYNLNTHFFMITILFKLALYPNLEIWPLLKNYSVYKFEILELFSVKVHVVLFNGAL